MKFRNVIIYFFVLFHCISAMATKHNVFFKRSIVTGRSVSTESTYDFVVDSSRERIKYKDFLIPFESTKENYDIKVVELIRNQKKISPLKISVFKNNAGRRYLSVKFENVISGDRIRVSIETKKQNYDVNKFEEVIFFSESSFNSSERFEYDSDVPLTAEFGRNSLHSQSRGNRYTLEFNRKSLTDADRVFIQSNSSWRDINSTLSKSYESLLSESIDTDDVKILASSLSIAGDYEKISTLVSFLRSKLGYSIENLYTDYREKPRSLKKIFEERKANCKDFSLALTKLLRNVGLTAFPALVQKDTVVSVNYASVTRFDHAVVKVISNMGEEFWVDAVSGEISKSTQAESKRPYLLLDGKSDINYF